MGNHGASPPPVPELPPTDPRATGAQVPHPPTRPRRLGGVAAGLASTPHGACSRRTREGQANLRQHTRAPHTDGARGQRSSPEPGVWGPRPPWRERRQRHPLCCLPREGRGTARGKATPRLTGPPWPHRRGGRRAAPPPHPTPPPGAGTPQTRRSTVRGAHSPKPGRGETGTPPPNPASQTEHGTDAGHAPGQAPRGTALLAPSTGTARGALATPTRGGGRGDAARARSHTHTKDTRGIPEAKPDRVRETHGPHGMAYQPARIRDTQEGRPATHSAGNAGREEGNGEDTTPGTGPSPSNLGKPGRDRAPGPVNPRDSATRQEVCHEGPST